MTEQQKVIRVTRNNEGALFELLVYAAVLYLVVNPAKLEQARDTVRTRWERFLHRYSIWQARGAIRSLPETDK